jgi:maltose O-acetyltransferase
VLTEKEKMLAGERYNPADATLASERAHARSLCHRINLLDPGDRRTLRELLCALVDMPTDAVINPPFHCDYGYNIALGLNAYFNVNCVVLDVMRVTIGRNALFGPAVQIYTAMHAMSAEERRSGLEYGRPVDIGDDVWVGGGAVICPGVSVGSGSVIGAGSVVTRNLPEGVFAAGNPCRVIRKLNL